MLKYLTYGSFKVICLFLFLNHMNEIQSLVKSEVIQTCILLDKDNEVSWCVYHDDIEGARLTFTKNLSTIESIESFENTSVEEIEEHLNQYGFEIEPKEDFGDVLLFDKLTDSYKVKLIDVEFNKYCSLKFTI
jgi:hypothetical protein